MLNITDIVAEAEKRAGIKDPELVLRPNLERFVAALSSRGSNPYTLEQFGIDPDEAAELYSDYMRHFDIPREHEGLRRGD